MRNLKLLVSVSLFSLTACEAPSAPTVSAKSAVATTTVTEPTTSTFSLPVVDPTSPSNIPLTYYKKSVTAAPVNGFSTKTYTATGYCVVYNAATYCWDDGMKTIDFTSNSIHYGPYTYTYWGMGTKSTGSPWGQCSGGCEGDLMSQPTLMTTHLTGALTNVNGVTQILNTGTPVSVNCTEGNQVLNCNDFVIDLSQVAL